MRSSNRRHTLEEGKMGRKSLLDEEINVAFAKG
jgi:hypothetical protein